MSKQRIVKDEIWDDEWFYDLDPSEKLIWLFLLTNPRTNITGIFKINVRWIANLTGFDKDVVKTILQRFVDDDKIVFEDEWIALKNFHKHLAYKNPSITLGIKRMGQALTGCPQAVYSVYLTLLNSTLLNLSDTEEKSSDNKKNMGWNKQSDNDDDMPAIDLDSGEEIVTEETKADRELKELNTKIRANLKTIEPLRGIPWGTGKDMNFQVKIYRELLKAGHTHEGIISTFMEIVESPHWKEKKKNGEYVGMNTVQFHLRNKKV